MKYLPPVASYGGERRVAYAINRATGSAVQRNRLRRRLRAAAAAADPTPGTYLIGAGRAALALTFDELRATVRSLMVAAATGPGPRPQ